MTLQRFTDNGDWPDDRHSVIRFCRELLQHDFIVLDTETTGLYDAEIMQLAILRSDGQVLLDTLVNCPSPEKALVKGKSGVCAADIHGIKPEMVKSAPTLVSLYESIYQALHGQIVTVFNLSYDMPLIADSWLANAVPTTPIQPSQQFCIMKAYAAFVGEWNDYYGNYRWQPLPGGDHSALGDCRATLALIKQMAETPIDGSSQGE